MSHLPPVRQLYRILLEMMGSEDLQENLNDAPGYRGLRGEPEQRFCEWAYTMIHDRKFAESLIGSVLRPSEVNDLASRFKQPPIAEGVSPRTYLTVIMKNHLGIHEPVVPKRVYSGLEALESFSDWATSQVTGKRFSTVEESRFTYDPVAQCRRATERLLKTIAVFFLNTDCKLHMKEVWENSLYGFKTPSPSCDIEQYILTKACITTMNIFLSACSKHLREKNATLPCLKPDLPLWSEAVFSVIRQLSNFLNLDVHDTPSSTQTSEPPLIRHLRCVQEILRLIENRKLPLPRVIQFFRKYDDGHQVYHYDGYNEDGSLLSFFEASGYQLHRPYLYLSATNPSCLDAVCTDVMPFLYSAI